MTTKKQTQNLRPLNKRTKTEQREIAKKGGLASGAKRRLIKNTKDFFDLIKSMPVNDALNDLMNEYFQTEGLTFTYSALNLFAILQAVENGNVSAMKLLTEIDGSSEREVIKPQQKANIYIVSDEAQAEAFRQAEQFGIDNMEYEDI